MKASLGDTKCDVFDNTYVGGRRFPFKDSIKIKGMKNTTQNQHDFLNYEITLYHI